VNTVDASGYECGRFYQRDGLSVVMVAADFDRFDGK
jgi:hypothetical protein